MSEREIMAKAKKRILEEWSGPPLKTRKVTEYYVKCDKCKRVIAGSTIERLTYLLESHYIFAHSEFLRTGKKAVIETLKE